MVGRRAALGMLVALGAGCAKPAFTLATRERYALSPADLRRVQFYTSGEIVLRREVPAQEAQASNAGLVMREGVLVEEVVIPLRTPGVALRVEGDFMLIGFVPQRPDKALWFGVKPRPNEEIVPLEDRRYELVQLENTYDEPGPFVPRYAKGYLLAYGGNQYQIADGRMWGVHLLYEEGSQVRQRIREETPGWKISDGVPPDSSAPAPAPR